MSLFRRPSHNNSHNTTSPGGEVRDSNLLKDNDAPGETRTPNLLIRSQLRTGYLGLRRAVLEWERTPEAAIETPKADKDSHNFSHNYSSPPSVYDAPFGSMPLAFRAARWTL